MDRLEFCRQLFLLRKVNGLKMRYISINTGICESQIKRMEKGSSNFSLERSILYLSALNYKIVLSKNGIKIDILSEDEAFSLFYYIRENNNLTYTSFGIFLGLTATHIKNIENKNNSFKIDIFLKMAEKFGYDIYITKNN